MGLGNPGPRYARTRHNAGFLALERLAGTLGVRLRPSPFPAPPLETGQAEAFGEELLLARPLTWMNRSGDAARALAERHGGAAGDFLVLYDDVALPLGRIRLRSRGSSGGHRGMESVIGALGTPEVPRLRLGILGVGGAGGVGEGAGAGSGVEDLADYVLEEFASDEWPVVEQMLDRSVEALETAIRRGVDAAASLFNRAESPEV